MTDIYNDFTAFDDEQPAPPPVPIPEPVPEETDEPDVVLAEVQTYTRDVTLTDWSDAAHWVAGGSVPASAILAYLRVIGYPKTTGVEADNVTGVVTISTTGLAEVTGPEWEAFDGSSAVVTTTVPWTSTAASAVFAEPRIEQVVAFWEYLEGQGLSPATMLRRWDEVAEVYSLVVMADKAVDPGVAAAFAFMPPSADVFSRFVVRSLTLNPGAEEGFVVKRKAGDEVLAVETGVDYTHIASPVDSDPVEETTAQVPVGMVNERPLPIAFGSAVYEWEDGYDLSDPPPNPVIGDVWLPDVDWFRWDGNSWIAIDESGLTNEGRVEIGHQVEGDGRSSVTIGLGSITNMRESITIGCRARSVNNQDPAVYRVAAIAIGSRAVAIGFASIALGLAAEASEYGSISVGSGSEATGTDAIAVGEVASAADRYAIAVGSHAVAASPDAIAVGTSASAFGSDAIAIGRDTEASQETLVVGKFAVATNYGMAIGSQTQANGRYSLALGREITIPYDVDLWRVTVIGNRFGGYTHPVGEGNQDTMVFLANRTRTVRSVGSGATTHQLYSADGTIGEIGVTNDDKIMVNGNVLGATGPAGATGPGVPSGGGGGQVLAKASNGNYSTQWISLPERQTIKSFGGATLSSVNYNANTTIGTLNATLLNGVVYDVDIVFFFTGYNNGSAASCRVSTTIDGTVSDGPIIPFGSDAGQFQWHQQLTITGTGASISALCRLNSFSGTVVGRGWGARLICDPRT